MIGDLDGSELVINDVPVLELRRLWFDASTGAMGKEASALPMYQFYAKRSAHLASGRSLCGRRMLFSQVNLTGLWRVGTS